MLDPHVRWEVLDLKRVRSPISLSLAPLVCHSCSLPRCLVRLFLALTQQPTGASCYITSTNIGLYILPSFLISVLLPLTGASFYSSPAQIAKRDELEAKQKAAKLADDEAITAKACEGGGFRVRVRGRVLEVEHVPLPHRL